MPAQRSLLAQHCGGFRSSAASRAINGLLTGRGNIGYGASNASLTLNFLESSSLNPKITFVRASTGSYYGSNGLLALTPVNVLTYSDDLSNAAWTKAGSVTTPSASTVNFPNFNEAVSQGATFNAQVGVSATFSVTLSGAGTIYIGVARSGGAAYEETKLKITLSATATRYSITHTIINAGQTGFLAYISRAADGTATAITAINAQLETGSSVTPYIPTTATASGSARFDYEPATLQPKGLLIEEQRTNLLTYSSELDNAAWTKTNATLNANLLVAPDGTLTSDKLVENATTNIHYVEQPKAAANSPYSFSVYLKAGERIWAALRGVNSVSANVRAWFNLSTGILGTVDASATATIISVGNGWYRCILNISSANTAAFEWRVELSTGDGVNSYTGDGNSGIHLWGAQLEAGAFATSYIPSSNTFTSRASTATYYGSNGLLQTAATNVPRYNYNPANLTLTPTLLLEAAATNLLTYSEQLDNAAWTKTAISITANSTTSPDGTITADTFISDTTNDTHRSFQAISSSSGLPYTFSTYLKANTHSFVQLLLSKTDLASTYYSVVFNLSTGAVTQTDSIGVTNTSSSIVSVGNGWYRCTITATATPQAFVSACINFARAATGNTIGSTGFITYTATGTLFQAWGAQLEAGAGATSYIPTVASQVTRAADLSSSAQTTRAADNASMTGTNFSSWFNAAEGTLFAQFSGSAGWAVQLGEGSNFTNRIALGAVGANFVVTDAAASNQAALGIYSGTQTTFVKMAGAYKLNDFAYSLNGGALDIDATGTVVSPLAMTIGFRNTATPSGFINGTIKSITYWPRRLSNTELQSVTA